ncbi:MAG: methionine aminotransferase [Crocinitomicaceae bacterium]|nr:methionine aminotransferase [Crocinitomicaceae bacterium]
MHTLTSKLPHVGTTIFTVMSKMAAEYNAINLSQGFPNFPVNKELLNAYHEVIDESFHQYMPMPGYGPLMLAVAEKIHTHYGRQIHPDSELLITAGATQAIFTAIQAVVHAGDEVVVLDPSYDCYAPSVELCGGRPVHVNLNADFSVNWNKVSDVITAKTRLIIVNNPHNPGGAVLSLTDIEALEAILGKHPHVLFLSDEVYEYIHFDAPHISANSREKLVNKTIVVSSFGKTFHVTGWKIGYLVAPDFIMSEIKKVHQFNVFCVNSTAQAALAKYLPQTDLSELSSFYKQKRDLFRNLITGSKFELLDCKGSYFQVARYSEISDLNDVDFSIELTKRYGVAVIPVSVFNKDKHDDKLIRFCFAKDNDTLIKSAEKLCKI